ncbi:uncharacterized protein FIESC28_04066 [Fusarium coffeatum]|uniref:Clr5 domain-containing protein n=1 Tax=Fusarium coffeatum TaxID=231269 RepID=A0A366S193_9HYPO|nr:uncharacterized protein FIESC28_04066 [Fusarium coffeatum]RBR23071.1 hypothetical protein FIESC28_04066 [Fusarium coffeatum]
MPQAPRVSKAEWEAHRALITDLYINQNRTLDEVIEYMAALGFCPSRPQWIRKINVNWKLRKNSTKEEWQHASSLLSKRKENGKDTDLIMNGKIVSSKKRMKELKRYSTLQTDQILNRGNARKLQTSRTSHASLQQHDPKLLLNEDNACSSILNYVPKSVSVPDVVSRTIETVDEMFPMLSDHHAKEKSQWPIWIQVFQALLLISTNNIWHKIETSFTFLDSFVDLVLPKGYRGGLETLLIETKEIHGELATHLLFSVLKFDSPESSKLMRFLLRSGVSPNSTHPKSSFGSRWWTALHEAVYQNSQESVKILIEFGANPHPDSNTTSYRSHLDMAPEHLRDYSIMHLPSAVDNGIRSNDHDHSYGVPPLFLALRNGSLHCAAVLLDAGADPNYCHPLLFTALHCAIGMANLGMVRLLIKAGALPNIRPLERLTTPLPSVAKLQKKTVLSPLQAAVRSKSLPIVEYLLYSGARPEMARDLKKCRNYKPYYANSVETGLQIAASAGDLEMMCLLLTSDANPNFRHRDTPTALQIVCGSPSMSPLERYNATLMLLQHGADINASPVPRGGRTALQAAVEADDYRVAEVLLHEGADPNAPAMEAVIKCGSQALNRLLIEKVNHEVALDSRDEETYLTRDLELAVSAGNIALLKSIFTRGDDRNFSVSVEDAERAVKAAIVKGSLSLVQELLTICPQIDSSWVLSETVWQEKSEILEWILSWLPCQMLNTTQPSPLWIALHQRNSSLVRRLLLAGADPNYRSCHICRPKLSGAADCPKYMSRELESPIEQAISPGHGPSEEDTETIQMLVSHGADINCRMGHIYSSVMSGDTPLLFAVKQGKYKIAELLLHKGAEPNAVDIQTGQTSIIYASRAANYGLVRLLIENGADVKNPSSWGTPIQALTDHRIYVAPEVIRNLARICRLLLDSGADVNANTTIDCSMTALQTAIVRGIQELIEIFLREGANIDAPAFRNGGRTALQAAASTVNFKLVKRLVEMGADINAPPAKEGGATTLQYAAMSGHVNMAIFLLEHGASVNAQGSLLAGVTALQGASEYGRLDMVHLLVENDQDPDTIEERCRDAANISEKKGFTQTAEFLRGYKRP